MEENGTLGNNPLDAVDDIPENMTKNKQESQIEIEKESLLKEIDILQKQIYLHTQRQELICKATNSGLIEINIIDGQVDHSETTFRLSNEFTSLLGYSEDELPNNITDWFALLHPEDLEFVRKRFYSHLEDKSAETSFVIKCRILDKNGNYLWMQGSGDTLRDEMENPIFFLAQFRVIQKEKIQETEFEIISTRFDLLNQATSEGYWDMVIPADMNVVDDTYVWYSEQFRKMLGYQDESDFPNRMDSWSVSFHPEDIERVFEQFQQHIMDKSGETEFDTEYRLKLKSGEFQWFRSRGAILLDEVKQHFRSVGSLKNINEEKQIELEIQSLLKEINRLTESAIEGKIFSRFDTSNFQDYNFVHITQELNSLLDSIVQPIDEGIMLLQKLQTGDFSQKLEIECKGEHLKLKESINSIQKWFSEISSYLSKIVNGDGNATLERISDIDPLYENLEKLKNKQPKLTTKINPTPETSVELKITIRSES
ncbi:MAG: PAS domain-containing protein [Leptospiraceae bacterium]|nr:PAS domain-containing protein [Leptospiraceae bacterium]MCP5496847.1 PAS domain-containing protein [Leptospiraceae bacterium]